MSGDDSPKGKATGAFAVDLKSDLDALGEVLRTLDVFQRESLRKLDAITKDHEGNAQGHECGSGNGTEHESSINREEHEAEVREQGPTTTPKHSTTEHDHTTDVNDSHVPVNDYKRQENDSKTQEHDPETPQDDSRIEVHDPNTSQDSKYDPKTPQDSKYDPKTPQDSKHDPKTQQDDSKSKEHDPKTQDDPTTTQDTSRTQTNDPETPHDDPRTPEHDSTRLELNCAESDADAQVCDSKAMEDRSSTNSEDRSRADGESNDGDDERSGTPEDDKEDAHRSLAKALNALTSLNLRDDAAQLPSTSAGGGEGGWGPAGAVGEGEAAPPRHQRVKFDIDALNEALANLLTLTSAPLDIRVLEAPATSQVSTPPPTPLTHPHTPPQSPSAPIRGKSEDLPAPKGRGPPPPKPPRCRAAMGRELRLQTTLLSQSTGDLREGRRPCEDPSPRDPSLSACSIESDSTDGGGTGSSERKENIFLSALKGRGVRQRIKTLTKRKRKTKRSKSLQISAPWDFKHLAGASVPSTLDHLTRIDETHAKATDPTDAT